MSSALTSSAPHLGTACVAIGIGAVATGTGSVAIGTGAVADEDGMVSLGHLRIHADGRIDWPDQTPPDAIVTAVQEAADVLRSLTGRTSR